MGPASVYLMRRLAAFVRIFLDHVTGFSSSASAAAQIAGLSASVSGILMSSCADPRRF